MKRMTKIQFDVIYKLSVAYGHEWAWGLAHYAIPKNRISRVERFREGHTPDPDDIAYLDAWDRWYALCDRVALGYVPTFAEIGNDATILWEDSHFPTTCDVRLTHETCSRQTRWSVLTDGEVQFERLGQTSSALAKLGEYSAPTILLARARVFTARNGSRVAVVDAVVPVSDWTGTDRTRFHGMLTSAGCSAREANRAIDATQFNGPNVCRFDLAPRESVAA
jgi:hypothetical protein